MAAIALRMSSRENSGIASAITPSPASVSRPPDTTAAWVPMSDAATLASAFPISGPEVTTRMWIDDTRPRSESGVRICTIPLRSTALMTSAPADSARNPSASGKLKVASPNPVIPSPQTATAISTARPAGARSSSSR